MTTDSEGRQVKGSLRRQYLLDQAIIRGRLILRPIVSWCSPRETTRLLPKYGFVLSNRGFGPCIVRSACIFRRVTSPTPSCQSYASHWSPKYREFPLVQLTIISAEPLPAIYKPFAPLG